MKILALEFSSAHRSVAVLRTDAAANIVAESESTDSSPGKTMRPLAMVERVLRETGLDRSQITRVAVGLGPGSYTGIRVAISLAQGWQIATGVELVGINSVDCIASRAVASGINRPFSVIVDAQRGEFYLAGFKVENGVAHGCSPLQIVSRETVLERERAGDLLIGPEVKRWFPHGHEVPPSAAMLAKLAFERGLPVSGDKLDPIYLRETTFVKAPPPRIS